MWQGYAVHSLGTLVGLRGDLLAAALVHACRRAGALADGERTRTRYRYTTVAAFALGALIVTGHRKFPMTGPYAGHAYRYITSTWEPPRTTPRQR